MNFSETFQIAALELLSYLVARIINHMIIFLSDFSFPSSFFVALRRSFFEIFIKLQKANNVMGYIYIYIAMPQVSGNFLGEIFLSSQNK